MNASFGDAKLKSSKIITQRVNFINLPVGGYMLAILI